MAQSTPVSKNVNTSDMKFGSQILSDGKVRFRIWAPTAKTISLVLLNDGGRVDLALDAEADGWYSKTTDKAGSGSLYQFWVNNELAVPDPASRYQPSDVHGPSMVIDPSQYQWKCPDWKGRPWEETVLYELHVGTFTPEGTFAAVQEKLDYLHDLGVTAIELMPVADFPGDRNWGYDGVLQYAPDSSYGTPDDLRALVDAAHQKGMMVFLDVVYNHFGPDGNYLHVYAKQFFNEKHHTPWGAAINFDGAHNEAVREFYVENVLYWLNEFRFDGLRFDAVHAIIDDSKVHILKEISRAVKEGPALERQIHLVLENDENISDWLERDSGSCKYYHAQWNDDVHHAMHAVITGENYGYYADYCEGTSKRTAAQHLARCLTQGFAYQDEPSPFRDDNRRGQVSSHLPPTAFVAFIQNHDQIGNRAFGDRIAQLGSLEANKAMAAVLLLSPNIPLIFMGQEWGATTPFQYFADLGPELAPLVTAGRRKEFAKFPEFQDAKKRELIPDPVDKATFRRSKLNWADLEQAEHREMRLYYRKLLLLRAQAIAPLLDGCGENVGRLVLEQNGLIVAVWSFAEKSSLCLIANLSDRDASLHECSSEIKKLSGTKPIFESSAGAIVQLEKGLVPAWSVVWAHVNDKI